MKINPGEVQFLEDEQGALSVIVGGYQTTNYLGYPALPFKVIAVMLPQGEEVADYRVEVREHIELDPSVPLAPFAGEYRDDGIRLGVNVKQAEEIIKDSIFPRWRVRHLGTNFYRGYLIASFAVYPFNYNISTGSLGLDSDIRLVVETEPSAPVMDRIERMRHVEGFRDRAREAAESIVVNPGMSSSYTFDEIEVDTGDRGFVPSYLPSMEGSEVAYLIVTNEEMAPAYEVLADWKTREGIPTVVRTVEWIQQNYWSGADRAESIRHFIQEAYAKWGVEWVLLGGDTDVIPARYGLVMFYEPTFIPTDMYFSCLDGTWNADGDSLWGEAYHDAMNPGDETDLYAEVYLGRMPSSTFAEADVLVGKVLSYSTPLDTLSKRKFCILAEVIFPDDYQPGDDIILDGAEITENVYENYLDGNPDVTTARLYQTCALYPGSICISIATSLDSLGTGQNHVLHTGHGFKYNMSVGDGSILNYDASILTNGDALFSMYLMNCTNAAFDVDCLAEAFLLNPNGGAVAVTGSSRSAFPSSSRPYLDYYYYLLYAKDVVHLAEVHTRSRVPYT
ncbi:MAG TPA: C25 family cysteine peptidase, partial [Patescibacteria group bacterium]|nr:C25 family cysteine peptidase [Patescibacteria group bacterium]